SRWPRKPVRGSGPRSPRWPPSRRAARAVARLTGRDPGARPHPRQTIREACQRWGEAEVVRRCVDILNGAPIGGDELDLLGYLAATRSRRAPRGGSWPAWYPVWALRCLRYVWRPEAAGAVVAATSA